MPNQIISCPLCLHSGENFYNNHYYVCSHCKGIFMDKGKLPDPEKEKARYTLHENDISDKGYLDFVHPLANEILKYQSPGGEGLDFGAGPNPDSAISSILKREGYTIRLYDPFFHANPELLSKAYDFISCCEVMEHFHQPNHEFSRLKKLLKPNGRLYCMTHIYSPETDFKTWYYKNDFTHVFFYQRETLEWIKREYGFSEMIIKGRLIVFIN